MRISRTILLIFLFLVIIRAQTIFTGEIEIEATRRVDFLQPLLDEYSLTQFDNSTLEQLLQAISQKLEEEGFFSYQVYLARINPTYEKGIIYVNPGIVLDFQEKVMLDSLIFLGIKQTEPRFLQLLFEDIKGKPYSRKIIQASIRRLHDYPFLELKTFPEIYLLQNNSHALVFQFDEKKTSSFSVVMSMVPGTGKSGSQLAGELQIHLGNIGGSGRDLYLHWRKVNAASQFLNFKFYYPLLMGSDNNLTLKFTQNLKDTLFVSRDYFLELSRISSGIRGGIYLEREVSDPTPAGRRILLLRSQDILRSGFSFTKNNLDHPPNPANGYLLEFSTDAARITSGSYQFSSSGKVVIVKRIRARYLLFCQLNEKIRWQNRGKVPYEQRFWIGGSGTIRGYLEDFFSGEQVYWSNLEIRYPVTRLSRLAFFLDSGLIVNDGNVKKAYGYGLSLQLETRAGLLNLAYALGRGDTPGEGKIHFRLSTTF